MNALSRLWKSIGNLAAAFDGLAGVVDAAAGRLRQQLALEGEPAPAGEVIDQPSALPAAAEGNGRRPRARA